VTTPDKECREELRRFLAQHFREEELADDQNLFQTGFVTSLFALELVEFIEASFGFLLEHEDLELENFASIDAMAALVARRSRGTR
jgi:acyl carrier protein